MTNLVKAFQAGKGTRTQLPEYQTPAIKGYMEAETREIVRRLPQRAFCLEVGCGVGRFIGNVSRLRPDVKMVGIDHCEELVERTRNRYKNNKDITIEYGEATRLPEEWEATFDAVVFVFNTLGNNLPPEDTKAVQEARRVLKPGGKLFVSVYSENALEAQQDLFKLAEWEVEEVDVEHSLIRLKNGWISRRFTSNKLRAYCKKTDAVSIDKLTEIAWLLVVG